jgi:hypothetical protein
MHDGRRCGQEDLSVLIHSNNRPFLVVKMLGNIIRRFSLTLSFSLSLSLSLPLPLSLSLSLLHPLCFESVVPTALPRNLPARPAPPRPPPTESITGREWAVTGPRAHRVRVMGSRVYTDAAGVKAQRWSSAADLKPFDAAIINSALTVERQVCHTPEPQRPAC